VIPRYSYKYAFPNPDNTNASKRTSWRHILCG